MQPNATRSCSREGCSKGDHNVAAIRAWPVACACAGRRIRDTVSRFTWLKYGTTQRARDQHRSDHSALLMPNCGCQYNGISTISLLFRGHGKIDASVELSVRPKHDDRDIALKLKMAKRYKKASIVLGNKEIYEMSERRIAPHQCNAYCESEAKIWSALCTIFSGELSSREKCASIIGSYGSEYQLLRRKR